MNASPADILVVDDDLEILRVLVDLLSYHGYRTRATGSGRQGVAAAQADPPDLVLLDIAMPGVDGLGVLESLKADRRTRDVPVVFLSGKSSAAVKAVGMEYGAVDYITKPFDTTELLARIRMHLRLAQLQRSERNLLEHTLVGTVRQLVGIPPAAAEGSPDAPTVARSVAERLALPDAWEIELAALLLEPAAWDCGAPAERAARRAAILELPRMEGVAGLLAALTEGAAPGLDDRAEIIVRARQFVGMRDEGSDPEEACSRLAGEACHGEILRSLRAVGALHDRDVA